MRFEIVTPPATEPITVAEARAHLRLGDDTSQDDQLARAIASARERVEAKLGRSLITQTLDFYLDRFPCGGGFYLRRIRDQGWDAPNFLPGPVAIVLPCPPLQSVSSVKYLDASGVLQTLDPASYRVIPSTFLAGKVEPALNASWPTTAPLSDAVVVRIVAGYGDASSVPSAIKSALLLIVGHLHEHREEVTDGPLPALLERGVDALLSVHNPGRYR